MLTEFCVHFGIEDAAAAGADSLPIGKGTHADGCGDVFGLDEFEDIVEEWRMANG